MTKEPPPQRRLFYLDSAFRTLNLSQPVRLSARFLFAKQARCVVVFFRFFSGFVIIWQQLNKQDRKFFPREVSSYSQKNLTCECRETQILFPFVVAPIALPLCVQAILGAKPISRRRSSIRRSGNTVYQYDTDEMRLAVLINNHRTGLRLPAPGRD